MERALAGNAISSRDRVWSRCARSLWRRRFTAQMARRLLLRPPEETAMNKTLGMVLIVLGLSGRHVGLERKEERQC